TRQSVPVCPGQECAISSHRFVSHQQTGSDDAANILLEPVDPAADRRKLGRVGKLSGNARDAHLGAELDQSSYLHSGDLRGGTVWFDRARSMLDNKQHRCTAFADAGKTAGWREDRAAGGL